MIPRLLPSTSSRPVSLFSIRKAGLSKSHPQLTFISKSRPSFSQIRLSSAAASAHGDEHGHDDHGHGAEEASPSTPDDFSAPIWKYTFIAVLSSFLIYRFSLVNSPQMTSAAHNAKNSQHSSDANHPGEAEDEDLPWLTRYIAYHTPRDGIWKERNKSHLDLLMKDAQIRVMVGDGVLDPEIKGMSRRGRWRPSYGSPRMIPVGSDPDTATSTESSEE